MAEPFTNEDFTSGRALLHVDLDGPGLSDEAIAQFQEFLDRVVATFRQLIRERDEARGVARTMATHEYFTQEHIDAAQLALAYPEVRHG